MQLTSALLLEVKKRGGGGKDDAVSIRKTDDHPYWQTGTSTIQGLFFFFLCKVAHAAGRRHYISCYITG